jgi:hypothetical protein
MGVENKREKDIQAEFRIPDHKDIIKGELIQSGEWIIANIETDGAWPIVSQKVRWRGVDIWILPIMKGLYPSVTMKVPLGKSRLDCEELVCAAPHIDSVVGRGARPHD